MGSPGLVLFIVNAILQRVKELPRVCSGGSCRDSYQLLSPRESKNITCCKAGEGSCSGGVEFPLHFLPS